MHARGHSKKYTGGSTNTPPTHHTYTGNMHTHLGTHTGSTHTHTHTLATRTHTHWQHTHTHTHWQHTHTHTHRAIGTQADAIFRQASLITFSLIALYPLSENSEERIVSLSLSLLFLYITGCNNCNKSITYSFKVYTYH